MQPEETVSAADRLCLEFVNTVRWRASSRPEETLHSYPDLARWSQRVGLISPPRQQKLLREAAARLAEPSRALRRAIALRESICRIFLALIDDRTPAEADLAVLNKALTRMTRRARVVRSSKQFVWQWDVDEEALDSLIGPIALSASSLMTSLAYKRVGQCADDRGCGWLFLDQQKPQSPLVRHQ